MIEQQGTVQALEGELAVVAVARQSACGSCSAKTGCGTSLIGSLFPQREQRLRLPNTVQAEPGDRVVIGLPEAGLQRASLMLYGLPLAGLIGGAALGQAWGGDELRSVLGGVLGAVLALFAVRRWAARSAGLRPVLLRRLAPAGVAVRELKGLSH